VVFSLLIRIPLDKLDELPQELQIEHVFLGRPVFLVVILLPSSPELAFFRTVEPRAKRRNFYFIAFERRLSEARFLTRGSHKDS
jgi:hypothetical protein